MWRGHTLCVCYICGPISGHIYRSIPEDLGIPEDYICGPIYMCVQDTHFSAHNLSLSSNSTVIWVSLAATSTVLDAVVVFFFDIWMIPDLVKGFSRASRSCSSLRSLVANNISFIMCADISSRIGILLRFLWPTGIDLEHCTFPSMGDVVLHRSVTGDRMQVIHVVLSTARCFLLHAAHKAGKKRKVDWRSTNGDRSGTVGTFQRNDHWKHNGSPGPGYRATLVTKCWLHTFVERVPFGFSFLILNVRPYYSLRLKN